MKKTALYRLIACLLAAAICFAGLPLTARVSAAGLDFDVEPYFMLDEDTHHGVTEIPVGKAFALSMWVGDPDDLRTVSLVSVDGAQEYVLSARATGAKGRWIIAKHLIPNCISVVIISAALQIPSAIFTESYLSFLGLGVNAPMPSLGSLASEALNGYQSHPHWLVIPAVVISLIVLSLNLFGDGLRDAFDPKLNA